MATNKRPSSASSSGIVRVGRQKPKHKAANGTPLYTDGPSVVQLAASLGLNLFEWQRDIIDDWCSRSVYNVNGDDVVQPTFITCGLDVPRQNGKNACLEAYEIYALVTRHWHILHTAHRVKTTKKAFYRLVKYFTDKDFVKQLHEMGIEVTNIRRTNGEEMIELSNEARIEFASRTNGAARGYDDIQLCIYDEAQELTQGQQQSIDYSLSASTTDGGAKQKIFAGTPPYEGCNGTVFARQRSAALNVTPNRTTWSSWACEELPHKNARFEDLLDEVYACNPSMGMLLDIDYTATEFAGSTLLGFAQERLDWWAPMHTQDYAIPADLWNAAAIPAIGDAYKGKAALAIKFARDGATAYLAGCKQSEDGRTAAVELIDVFDMSNGTQQIASWLMERKTKYACVYIDGLNGADALIDKLVDMRAPRGFIVRPNASDVVAAAVTFLDGLAGKNLMHTSYEELDRSATESVKRPIGKNGGWGFGAGETTESYAVEAAALAYRAVKTTRRDPSRKGMAA